MTIPRILLGLFVGLLCLPVHSYAQSYPLAEDVASIDGIIRATYESISGPKGVPRQWERDASLFTQEATITSMGTNRRGVTNVRTVTLAEYQTNADWSSVGFFETEISREVQHYGGLAHVWSTYEYRTSENGPVLGRGINSFQLIHKDDRWWIRGLAFQGESAAALLPVVTATLGSSVADLGGQFAIAGKQRGDDDYTGVATTTVLSRDSLGVHWDVGDQTFKGVGTRAGEGRLLGTFNGVFSGYFELRMHPNRPYRAWWWSADGTVYGSETWTLDDTKP